MDDDFRFRSVGKAMALTPGKVVMVLDIEHHVDTKRPRNVCVNQLVIRGGIPSHELHRRPIFLAGFRREVEPREM